jgi:septal ring factor EnvC (AmiA/AmiB activator)
MANCDKCGERATQILSVGSLGLVTTLCPNHTAQAVAPFDAALIPYQLTGVEGSFSTEQSLDQRVKQLDSECARLRNELDGARHENTRLQELLVARLEEQNERLGDELEALQEHNEALSQSAAAEPVTRVD